MYKHQSKLNSGEYRELPGISSCSAFNRDICESGAAFNARISYSEDSGGLLEGYIQRATAQNKAKIEPAQLNLLISNYEQLVTKYLAEGLLKRSYTACRNIKPKNKVRDAINTECEVYYLVRNKDLQQVEESALDEALQNQKEELKAWQEISNNIHSSIKEKFNRN